MSHVSGIGSVFFKARDPAALSAWYRDVLGLDVQDRGGAVFPAGGGDRPPAYAVWSPFPADTEYFAPSTREFMVNLRVDDLDGL
jgi:catechol 2,3-dioxygenase-like lactoylglutathione lyase family enzyme